MSERFKKIEDVEDYLFSIPKFATKGVSAANFSLDKMRDFCDEMGNPQNSFSSIHVAGTNGKGTTCRMLASVYQSAGYKTGLYTSPHLISLNERFIINGSEISNEDLILFFNEQESLISGYSLTFFEITTAIAFWYFAKEKTDLAIIETGLGGRLDATNIIQPEASVITSVGLDHTDILGDTLEKIAAEKGGIIKRVRPVITGKLLDEALNVIRKIAKNKQSELFIADSWPSSFIHDILKVENPETGESLHLPDRKKIDARNISVVHSAVKVLQEKYTVPEQLFKEGIELLNVRYPIHAQFERLLPAERWYFDGAHNSEAIKELTDHLLEKAPAEKWTVILSFMKDKLNAESGRLWSRFPHIYLYEMEAERAASLKEMKKFFPSAGIFNRELYHSEKKTNQLKSELVIFSGSFYFYSIIKRWMGTRAIHVD